MINYQEILDSLRTYNKNILNITQPTNKEYIVDINTFNKFNDSTFKNDNNNEIKELCDIISDLNPINIDINKINENDINSICNDLYDNNLNNNSTDIINTPLINDNICDIINNEDLSIENLNNKKLKNIGFDIDNFNKINNINLINNDINSIKNPKYYTDNEFSKLKNILDNINNLKNSLSIPIIENPLDLFYGKNFSNNIDNISELLLLIDNNERINKEEKEKREQRNKERSKNNSNQSSIINDDINNFDISNVLPILEKQEEKINKILKNKNNSKNNNTCIEFINNATKNIQKDIDEYSKIKIRLSEIKLNYMYNNIIYNFYKNLYEIINNDSTDYKSYKLNIISKNNIKLNIKNIFDDVITYKNMLFNFSNEIELITLDSDLLFNINNNNTVKDKKETRTVEIYIIKKDEIQGLIVNKTKELINFIENADRNDINFSKSISDYSLIIESDIENNFQNLLEYGKYIAINLAFNFIEFSDKKNKNKYISKYLLFKEDFENNLKLEYETLSNRKNELEIIINDYDTFLNNELKKLNCISDNKKIPTVESGSDINFKKINNNPNILDIEWWNKFCELSNIINLIPIYYPVGILIPTPFNILKIPTPIFWKPIFVSNNGGSLITLLVGQCGVIPSPFLFLMNTGTIPLGFMNPCSTYFPVAIRPNKIIRDFGFMFFLPEPSIDNNFIDNLMNNGNSSDFLKYNKSIEIDKSFDCENIISISKDVQTISKTLDISPKAKEYGFIKEINPEITEQSSFFINDDFPAWERLSIKNPNIIFSLNKWCSAGKSGGGFFENPF